ncbi:MAG: hypothetical protein AAGC54_11850 [Cyanobacteria bacterium P01_F01_bin.4]
MRRLLLPILSACVFAAMMMPAAKAESTLPDTFEKQGITLQIGTPSRGHRYPYIRYTNIRYPSRRTYRYYRYGRRPNRRIYWHYPQGHRPSRRTFRYYRYDHSPQGQGFYLYDQGDYGR